MHRFCVLLLVSFSLPISGQPLFEQVFDAGGIEQGKAGLQDAAGDYWLSGSTDHSFGNKLDLILYKLDSMGQVILSKQYGGIDHDAGYGLATDSGGAVLVCGYTYSQGNGNRDIWLLKCNTQGDTLWQSVWGGPNAETAYRVFSLAGSQYLAAGETRSFGHGNYDLLLVATDSSGQVLWSKTYGGNQSELFADAIQTADGGLLLGGRSTGFTNGGNDWYIVKTDATGDTLWTRHFGTSGNDYLDGLATDAAGYYYLLGTEDVLPDSAQLTLKKLDISGQLIWSKHLPAGLGARGRDMCIGSEGHVWITGYKADSLQATQMMLLEADTGGQLLQIKLFGNTGDESGQNIFAVGNGHYLLTGTSSGFGKPNNDMYAVCSDSLGSIPCPVAPTMDAQDTLLCQGSFLMVKNTSVSSKAYSWLINDTLAGHNADFITIFDSSGLYRLSMVICTDTLSAWIQVPERPDVDFNWILNGDSILFHAQAIGGIKSLIWDFGDSSTGFGANPQHIFVPGQYYVRLDVIDTSGCRGQGGHLLTVYPTGISSQEKETILYYPIPAHAGSMVHLSGGQDLDNLSLFDLSGQLLMHIKIQNQGFELPTSLRAGTYVLQGQTAGKQRGCLVPVLH